MLHGRQGNIHENTDLSVTIIYSIQTNVTEISVLFCVDFQTQSQPNLRLNYSLFLVGEHMVRKEIQFHFQFHIRFQKGR